MGDAYMAAGGVPLRDKENPINCVLAALEIQQYMIHLKQEAEANKSFYWNWLCTRIFNQANVE